MRILFSSGGNGMQLVGPAATDELFGGNFLFNRDSLDTTNAGEGGAAFLNALEALGIRNLRYPGGTIGEDLLDLMNPDAQIQNGAAVTPLNEFMSFCGRNDIGVTIVIPTIRFLSRALDGAGDRYANVSEREIRHFVLKALEHAQNFGATVTAFEIGNEWYYRDMTATEYGRVASRIAQIISEVIEDFNDRQAEGQDVAPGILIQLGYQSHAEQETSDIFREFDQEELSAVSGLVTHRYLTDGYDTIHTDHAYESYYEAFDLWNRLSVSAGVH